MGQGFHFASPMDSEELAAYLTARFDDAQRGGQLSLLAPAS
jgi:hypothetical protein